MVAQRLRAFVLYLLYLPSTVTSAPVPFLVPTIDSYVYAFLCAYSLMSLSVLRNTYPSIYMHALVLVPICAIYPYVYARVYILSYQYLLLLILLLCHPTTCINIYYMCISLTI